ncbi:FAD-binding and (Fe-S)-binding domain-containing protein [Streptomyces xiaopingdaonensis]|uniref:FAD-binding and (Fe-S)-binding domain-containing protein n=1 Tax=Streptomyces xiaopingdaonensis TaxID=1565415 RepID=UPI0003131519|nr:FAD-binding and (Fe-S)-binding domain-containing protein [Streptomyces xiaopingdaonensis]
MSKTDISLTRRPGTGLDTAALERALRDRVDGEVRFDPGSRGAYATDASNYRQVPIGVVVPRTVDAGAEAVAVCREHGAPVLSRGGGTSLGGQATNTAVIVDWTKYCTRLLSVDVQARTCVVEPGLVLDDLNAQLAPYGLEFGPRPSTHSHCAIGGMVGNNSCGASAQRSGTTDLNVVGLEILTYDGLRCRVGPTDDAAYTAAVEEGGRKAELYRGLRGIAERYGDLVRERYPDIPRRVSGYNLNALLPEAGFDLARLVVGSEGTLATVLSAELKLMPVLAARSMLVLGYDSVDRAADAVPTVLEHCNPVLLEGVDDRLVFFEKEEKIGPEARALLPEGAGWLLVQFGGDTEEEAHARARELLDALGRAEQDPRVYFSGDPAVEDKVWKAREAGLGATARPPGMHDSWPGWEDSAVAPDRLGAYLRDLGALFEESGLDRPALYGHFGQGCVHVRTPFDLMSADGVADFQRFLERAADLVASYGGSLSGEHGDGQARGALLERMFGEELIRAFGEVKALFDPRNLMNPGKVVHPYGTAEHLRLGPDWRPEPQGGEFRYPHDDGSFTRAVMRCVGIGNCRRQAKEGGVMCPSYQVTREEEHSTRGRARLLFEMLHPHEDSPIKDGWRSTEVRDALDLCLACKGCKSDCPVGVDMATYKAEFLSHHYRGRPRPAAHYSMGWLPLWARLASWAPRAANAAVHAPLLASAGKRLAGIAPERDAPPFAARTLRAWWRAHSADRPPADPRAPTTVVVWPDTFTDHFHPHVGQAAVEVLEAAGFDVVVHDAAACCGLTWISTGQLGVAQRVFRRTLRTLRPWLEAGTPIVGLEPSCTAVFRSDMPEMLPDDKDVERLAAQTYTLAEFLLGHAPQDWRPPRLGRHAVVQRHCHQHAIMGFDADRELLARAGVDAEVLDSGCCGLAGNFGFEAGHHEVSMACAESALLPAVRAAAPETLVLADGFSCRTQIEQAGTGRTAMHLAEALHLALTGDDGRPYPEHAAAPAPTGTEHLVPAALALGTLAAAGTAGTLIRRRLRAR